MSVKVVWLVVCLPVLGISAQNFIKRNDRCTTPNKESAKCIPITECQVIKNALATRSKEAADFARKSQCGYDSVPLVCCGTLGKKEDLAGSPCTTPNGESAKCIPLTRCPVISDALRSGSRDAWDFANNSQCEGDASKICCGSEAYPIRSNLLPNRGACGEQKTEDKIWGGEKTKILEFPWLALLRYRTRDDGSDAGFNCGGTLINQRYILTAAHCASPDYNLNIQLDSVRLGEWQISTREDCETDLANRECADPVVNLRIEERIVHKSYDRRNATNDIALLRLERNVEFSDSIQPICLPVRESPEPDPGVEMVAAGWGSTENGSRSDVKLKVKLPIVARDICDAKIRQRGGVTENHICAGGQEGKDTCQGDSGGPLMREFSKKLNLKPRWYQEAVVSWGVACGVIGYPAVYTRVANYMDWIIDNLKAA